MHFENRESIGEICIFPNKWISIDGEHSAIGRQLRFLENTKTKVDFSTEKVRVQGVNGCYHSMDQTMAP